MNKKYIPIGLGIGIIAIGTVLLLANKSLVKTITPSKENEIVELKNSDTYDLTASYIEKSINGTAYRMLAYNGSIPGPMIKIPQGAEITINFKNDTDMKTLLHSHGVRMDNAFDGSQTTQKEMKPGETFAYKLKFPDAGVYWYHPHVREDYEQELGLYGNFLVVPRDVNYWNPVNREVSLFLDDILIENGAIRLNKNAADRLLMGRYGNVMLINGQTGYSLTAQKGEVIRFYLTNAANVRPFNFAVEGMRLKLVGGDNGAYEHDEWHDSVVISPSERVIVEALFPTAGVFAIENKTPEKTYRMGTVAVTEASAPVSYAENFNRLRAYAGTEQSVNAMKPYFDKEPDKRINLSLSMGMGGMMGGGNMMAGGSASADGIEWEDSAGMMNAMAGAGMAQWKITDTDTGAENGNINWLFKRGEPVKIRISNNANSAHPMQHPIHFHGQRFLVVARNGIQEENLVWKDTVLVPANQTVDILIDASNPGVWMAHCHIAEHLEAGMMFSFTVL